MELEGGTDLQETENQESDDLSNLEWCLLRDQAEYKELGGDFFDRQHPQRMQSRLIRRLERLGLQVVITAAKPLPDPAPPVRLRGRPCKCLERAIDCKHRVL